jgi:tripartite-type tricarboxylate transporter receptor subunit TctC
MQRYIGFMAAFALAAASFGAAGQAFPAKPIHTIVTFAGVGEALCRMVGQQMSVFAGQPVIVESQAAAGGAVGAEMVMKAAPDGYTILAANPGTHVMRQFLAKANTFDAIKDFTPITLSWDTVALLAVHPSLPVSSMKELIDYAKKNPGKISVATSGHGTSHHMALEMLKLEAGVDMVHVPYKNGAQSFQDAMGGVVPAIFGVLAQLGPAIKAGKLKAIAISNDKRSALVPGLPAISETVPGYKAPPFWTSYYGPAGLPAPIVRRLNGDLIKAINVAEVKQKLDDAGFVVVGTTPEELSARNKADIDNMARVVKAAGIQPE